jgi:aminopeptidase N
MLRDMTITPEELEVLQPVLEPLLFDRSYVTQELALFTLWVSYPEEKAKYLEQTKDVVGLPNKNIRLLWLTLAILTNEYDSKNTQGYFQELNRYTAPQYGWEVRMGAFQYLHQAIGLNEESLKNLLKATAHHSWQFKKFARNLVDELVKDTDYKTRFLALAKELKDDDLRYLNTKLKL